MHSSHSSLSGRFPARATHRLLSMLIALTLTLVTVAISMTHTPAPAHAAGSWGAGGFGWSSNGTWLGNFIAANGTYVYCVDLHISGVGSGGDTGSISSEISARGGGAGGGTRALNGAELRKINYAVTVHGQTSDDVTAAAVAAYVWNFTSTNHAGNGAQYIGGPRAAEIHARYQQIKADTEANAHLGGGTGTGQLQFDIDSSNHYLGTMTVSTSPTNAVGTVTLTNGVFADSGSATRTGVRHGDAYPVLGIAPADGSNYRISATASFTGEGRTTYGADVRLHSDAAQRTAGPGTRTPGVMNFTVTGSDTTDRTATFQPTVGTRVASTYLAQDEPLQDILTFSTSPDAHGTDNFWFRDTNGDYAPITARATIYGPFLAQPHESDSVPANAPVAVTDIMMTTSAADGPNIEYTVDSAFTPDEAGFYTWVWQILAEDQPEVDPAVRAFLPDDYAYTDSFGQVAETSVNPTHLAITTQVAATEVSVGQHTTDDVTVAVVGGGWLQNEGSRVPATLTATAYFQADEPELSAQAPADAEVVGTLQLTFTGAGTLTSDPLHMPLRDGYVVFQWCLNEADQPELHRGLLAETCDMYGQASETVRLVKPTVTTLATQHATLGTPIFDTAVVDGEVPAHTSLSFAIYEQLDAAAEPVCLPENLVTTTETVAVREGKNSLEQYQSPDVLIERAGTYWWVESLVHDDPDTGTRTIISSGECGIANETTVVTEEPPPAPPTPSLPQEPAVLAETGAHGGATPLQLAWLLIGAGLACAIGAAVPFLARRSNEVIST
ncbi:MAG: hypothetical protein GX862_06710 [Leucobacter sp.]|nr:hypothetical protein [Leucobacter sp.]